MREKLLAVKEYALVCMLFMFMKGDYVSELWPPMDLLFISQLIHMSIEPQWNDSDRGQPKNSGKNLFQCHFVYRK
jgi:hypothetical protein